MSYRCPRHQKDIESISVVYREEKLDTVLHLIKNKSSLRGAAKKLGIAPSTVRYILKKNNVESIDVVDKLTMNNSGMPRTLPRKKKKCWQLPFVSELNWDLV